MILAQQRQDQTMHPFIPMVPQGLGTTTKAMGSDWGVTRVVFVSGGWKRKI